MKTLTKLLAGTAGAAALALTAASPAQAQSWGYDRYDYYDRDRGIDVGDIATGIAVVGGIAALISAFDGNDRYDYGRYGYNRGYGYNQGYYGNRGYGYGYGNQAYGYGSARAAVNACGLEAQRIGRNVQITDLDRTNRGYRVRGRFYVADYDGRGWNRRVDYDREDFTCYAANGRIYDFNV